MSLAAAIASLSLTFAPRPRLRSLTPPLAPRPRLRTAGAWLQANDYNDEYCMLPEATDLPRTQDLLRGTAIYDAALFSVPAIVPFAAYQLYPLIMDLYHFVVDIISSKTWYTVDGGASRISELLPVTNGIVVPSVSVAFGTLTAITIQSLRQRQISIRALLNKEACSIRSLHAAVLATYRNPVYEFERFQLALLLRQYLSRLIFESRAGIDLVQLERLGASDSEIDGVAQALMQSEERPEAAAAPMSERQLRFASNTQFAALTLVKELQQYRSDRLALLQTPFPAVHWLILATLAGSITLAYLFETDAQLLQFLDDLQLRYLFTVLVGSFAALASLCADLADPFRGSFCITPSTQQLESLRELITQESCSGRHESSPPTRAGAAPAGAAGTVVPTRNTS